MRKRAAAEHSEGFALIEALASLVIVGMISLMILQGVGVGKRVWERIDSREAVGETIDGAQTALRDRVEQIFPATLYDQNPPYIDFEGASRTLVFIASPAQSERPGPLRRYALLLTTAGNLTLSSVSDVNPDAKWTTTRQVLVGGVRDVDIAYFGVPNLGVPIAGAAGFWQSSWRGRADLPRAIRVRLAFEPGDPRRWPELIVQPRADIDSGCYLNPMTHRCKGRL